MPFQRIPFRVALVATALLAACASDPSGPGETPPQVQFKPSPGTIVAPAQQSLEFVVEVDGVRINASFFLDDVPQGNAQSFTWEASALGTFQIEARVDVEGTEHRATWTVEVTDDGALPAPPVPAFDLESGDIPGSLQVVWDAPGPSTYTFEPADFLVAWSTDAIDDSNFDQIEKVAQPWDRQAIKQFLRIEGLTEDLEYNVRIRTRDVLGRVSTLSPQIRGRATGHFDLAGSVRLLIPELPTQPGVNVVVDWNGIKTVTESDGTYALNNLADTVEEPLVVTEGSGLNYYSITTGPLPVVNQSIDLVLFPRDFVPVTQDGNTTSMPRLEFMAIMTSDDQLGENEVVHRWNSYPVPVYARPHVVDGQDGPVDYPTAFARGVDLWNQVAGADLLVMVDAPVSVGIEVIPRPLNDNLGTTVLVDPGGALFENDPVYIQILIRETMGIRDLVDRIAAHELGHALLIPHSPDQTDLMHLTAPSSSNGIPDRDVAFVARFVAECAPGTQLRWYADPEP